MSENNGYRVILSEFKGGRLLAELPVSGLSFRSILNAPGSASFTVPLAAEPLAGLDWSLISPWRIIAHVQRGSRVLWGGPLLTWSVDLAAEEMTLDCVGLWEYYRRNMINLGYSTGTTPREQTTIARELIQTFADNPSPAAPGQLGYWGSNGPGALTFDPDLASVRRERTYPWYEWKSVGEAVEQLGAVIKGFDFRIDHDWDVDARVIRNRFRFLYPAGGVDTGIVLEHGTNCTVTSVTSDGDKMCTETGVNGAGEGWSQLKSWWYNGPLETTEGRRIPRLSAVETNNSVVRVDTLTAQAERMTAVGAFPLVVPEVTLHPGGEYSAAELRVGHKIRVRARTANWPGIAAEYVIQEINTKVTSSGEETTLALVPVTIFARVDDWVQGQLAGAA
ncbi:hypothetical protein [Kitasatospora sp. MBT66]|uniref:hypothetical protein n=1 Tax=Kitasatospora sp. MBT66 TaxID=1444769 RepID=UPI0005B97150|nr:hypothetical protein [Kitasatospora sp. MBT66]